MTGWQPTTEELMAWTSDIGEAMGDSASLLDPAGGSEEGECIWREIDDWHMKVFQKAPSKWAQRWRKASLAINALNQWRLVVESNQPVNKGKGTQATAIGGNSRFTQQLQRDDFNSCFTVPTLGEASGEETQLPNPYGSDDDEARRIMAVLHNFTIVKEWYMPDGIYKFELRSKEPVGVENFPQVASELRTLFEGSQDLGPLSPIPVPDDMDSFLDRLPDVVGLGSDDDFFISPSQSTTEPMMFSFEESRNDPLTPGGGTQADNIFMSEGDDGMESRQTNQQTRLDQSVQQLRNIQRWKDLVKEVKDKIIHHFDHIDQASDRAKLESVKTEVKEQADKLKSYVRAFEKHFEKHIIRFVDELKKSLGRFSSGVPNIRELMKAALFNKDFIEREWKRLFDETVKITKKLDGVVHQLKSRENSANKVFQNCASAITLSVDTILGKQSSKFISVSDFSHWYLKEVCNAPHALDFGSKAASY